MTLLPGRSTSPRLAFWLLPAMVLLFWNLDYAPLWNPDEGRYASASLEMVQPLDGGAPNWVVPQLNGIPRLNKPPLVYWTTGAAFKIFGTTDGAARFPSALAAIGVFLVLWQFGRRLFGERAGVLCAIVWATSALPFILAHTLNTDMLLTFSMTLAVFGLWLLSEKRSIGAVIIAGLGLGLALLAKGPVGVVLPVGSWILWLIATERKAVARRFPLLGLIATCLLAVLVGAPWYLAVAREHPEFLRNFLFGENLARLTGSQFYHNPHPPYFYVPVILLGIFPWSAFLIPAIGRALRRESTPESNPDAESIAHKKNRLLLWIWALTIIALFSISKAKLITYVLPAFPALAMLIAESLTCRADAKHARLITIASRATGAILIVLGIALPAAFLIPDGLSERIIPASEIMPFLVALSVVTLVIGALLSTKVRTSPIKYVSAVATAILLLMLTAAGHVSRYEDLSPMLVALQPYLKPQDEVIQFKTFQPTGIYYSDRLITVVDFENRSGLDQELYVKSGRFPKEHDVLAQRVVAANRQGRRVYVVAKWKHVHWPTLPPMYTIGRNNDYRLLSNKPAPAGYQYEAIAPKQRNRELSPECKALSPTC